MAVRRILNLSRPADAVVLRRRCAPVRQITAQVRAVITDLLDTFSDQPAYGLAAPQIGELVRIVVMKLSGESKPFVAINPELLRPTGEASDYDGCLSIPAIYADTQRAERLILQCRTPDNARIRRELSGFDARVTQHEVDHLDGILFIDRVAVLDDLYTLVEAAAPEPGESGEAEEPELESSPLFPEQMSLVKRNRRPLPDWAFRW